MTTPFADKTVLVLDKNLEDLKTLSHMLVQMEFSRVQVASSVNMALQLLREQPVDVCFLNYDLGKDEKNGLQLLYELRAEGNYRFSSSYILVVDKDRSSLLLGSPASAPDTYIPKPYNRVQLSQRLENVLRLKSALPHLNDALDRGRWQHAIDQTLLDERRYPGLSIYLRRMRAILHLKKNEPLSALALFRELLKDQTRPWIHVGVAIAASHCGQFELARKELKVVLEEQQQQCVEAFQCAARLTAMTGNFREAQQDLQKALRLQPTVGALHVELAQMAALQDNPQMVTQALKQAVRFNRFTAMQSPADFFGIARSLQLMLAGSKDTDNPLHQECLRVLEEVQHEFSERSEVIFQARLLTARRWRSVNDNTRADATDLAALEMFRALSLEQQALWVDLLHDELSTTPLQEMVAKLRTEVLKGSMKLPWAKNNLLATQAFRGGKVEEARDLFKQALEAEPRSIQVLLNYVQASLVCVERLEAKRDLRLADSARRLLDLRFPALTERQQQRYRSLLDKVSGLLDAAHPSTDSSTKDTANAVGGDE